MCDQRARRVVNELSRLYDTNLLDVKQRYFNYAQRSQRQPVEHFNSALKRHSVFTGTPLSHDWHVVSDIVYCAAITEAVARELHPRPGFGCWPHNVNNVEDFEHWESALAELLKDELMQ